jgi:menaquinone-dependent protoporphyrinogen IX oxidase
MGKVIMENKKVAITFTSDYGYIAEIAQEIAKILSSKGISTDIINLKRVRRNYWPMVENYNGILIGSNQGFWTYMKKQSNDFLRQNIPKVIERGIITGIFMSNPSDLPSILNPELATAALENEIMKKYGFKPSICAKFGPVIDLSRSSQIKSDMKSTLRSSAKSFSKQTGIVFNMKGYNDFRDWNRVHEFTLKFVDTFESKKITQEIGKKICPNCGQEVESSWKNCVYCAYKLK